MSFVKLDNNTCPVDDVHCAPEDNSDDAVEKKILFVNFLAKFLTVVKFSRLRGELRAF